MLIEYSLQVKHLVSVDCAIFGYKDNELNLLLFHRGLQPSKGEWSLIGGWVDDNESVDEAAERVLFKITGLKNINQSQVKVFSKPDRDPGGRVISVVFNALINIQNQNDKLIREYGAHWWPVKELPQLIFDHHEMVQGALGQLRLLASNNLVGRELLPNEFTLTQLRQLYNSIYMREFDPGNFRKKILSLNALERLNKKDLSESKKGAFYYKFKDDSEIEFTDRIIKY